MRNLIIEGKYVRLEEITPSHFKYIIEWRNNPKLNQYLNQPYKLTVESQYQWYKGYLSEPTQGLLVVVDKTINEPFGTLGWTDHNVRENSIILGRLLVGVSKYRGSKQWLEGTLLANDYFYKEMKIKIAYSHVMINNVASIKWHYKWGYFENREFKYEKEKFANGIEQMEFVRKYDDYLRIRDTIVNAIY